MKYSQNGIQYHIGLSAEQTPRYVLLPGDPDRCRKIAAYLDHPVYLGRRREFETWTGTLDGVAVGVTSTGIGGPSAAIAMQELVKNGADTFLRVGTCGGMQPDVLTDDLVIATGAIRAEGTSREYALVEYPAVADFNLIAALKRAASRLGFREHTGVVQCKDSFYGQHEPERMPVHGELEYKWNAWIKMGCLASEMESATLYIVAQYLRVRCASVLHVVANQIREDAGLDNPVSEDTDAAIHTAVSALRLTIAADKVNEELL